MVKTNFLVVSATLLGTQKNQGKHLHRFLQKDGTRFSKLFGIALLCLVSIVVRIAPITLPRHAQKNLDVDTVGLCVGFMLARGNSRRQDCGKSASVDCRIR